MRIDPKNLKPYFKGIIGFTGHETLITGMMTLSLSLGEWPKVTTEMVELLVEDLPLHMMESLEDLPRWRWDHILNQAPTN